MARAFTRSTLNYPQGADTPIQRVSQNRAPTTTDYKNFLPGDEWLDTSSRDWWKLVDVVQSSALWVKIGNNTGNPETLEGNSGGPVGPNGSFNIFVQGDNTQGINVTGNPATNTLTIAGINATTTSKGVAQFDPNDFDVAAGVVTLDGTVAQTYTANSGSATPAAGNLNVLGNNSQGINITGAGSTLTVAGIDSSTTQKGVTEYATAVETGILTDATRSITPAGLAPILTTPFVVAAGGAYTTIQSAINAASAGDVIVVRPGSYTEDLTMKAGIIVKALSLNENVATVTVTGTVTCTYTGRAEFEGIDFTAGAGDAIVLSGANATQLTILNSVINGSVGGRCFSMTTTSSNSALVLFNVDLLRNGGTAYNFNSNGILGMAQVALTSDAAITMTAPTSGTWVTQGAGGFTNRSTSIPGFGEGVVFSLGGSQTVAGATLTITNIAASLSNFTLQGPFVMTGTAALGGYKQLFETLGANITYNSSGSINIFSSTFSTSNNYAITGTGTGDILLTDPSFTPRGGLSLTVCSIFDPTLIPTLSEIGQYNPSGPVRISREAFNANTAIPAIAVVDGPAISAFTNYTNLGYVNSFLDLWKGGSTATEFGMWGMNAIFNGTAWVRRGDGASFNGAGYLRGQRDGTMELASFTSTGGAGATTTNPNVALRLSGGTEQFQAIYGSFSGSQEVTAQAGVQTANNTATTIASISLAELESITLRGTITGAQSDHTNAVGGDFLATAYRPSGGNITLAAAVVVRVISSSAATFTVDADVGTQTLRIRVSGVAATTYNWVTTYSYQKVLTNA